jgi:hypothetical protein
VRCCEADALNAWHIVHVPQQVCERVLPPAAAISSHARQVTAVRVHILTQQRHFLVACERDIVTVETLKKLACSTA